MTVGYTPEQCDQIVAWFQRTLPRLAHGVCPMCERQVRMWGINAPVYTDGLSYATLGCPHCGHVIFRRQVLPSDLATLRQ